MRLKPARAKHSIRIPVEKQIEIPEHADNKLLIWVKSETTYLHASFWFAAGGSSKKSWIKNNRWDDRPTVSI
jgi:hypothetical protein